MSLNKYKSIIAAAGLALTLSIYTEQNVYADEMDTETVTETSYFSEKQEEIPLPEETEINLVEDQQPTEGEDTPAPTPVNWIPSGVDLRDQGLVTPVKFQAPWSTCWAFSTVSAMETSVLSLENTTAQESGLDFSERYVIYFGLNPITETTDPKQAGEGLYLIGNEDDPNREFSSANGLVVETLISCGMGPVYDSYYPYHGEDGLTEYEFMLYRKDDWIAQQMEMLPLPAEFFELFYDSELQKMKEYDYYSTNDDWSIPEEGRNIYAAYVPVNINDLPDPRIMEDGKWIGINEEGINAIKSELEQGRAVSALFHADQSMPGVQGDDNYINMETWANYTYDDLSVNHGICIVGYDDNYPAENFTHVLYKKNDYGIEIWDENGNPIIDEEKTNKTTPPGNGAWIVKNSWGSETDWFTNENGRPINKDKWGLVNEEGKYTGYFYISYYDKTLKAAQTYQFGKDLDPSEVTLLQYDYLSAIDGVLEDRDEDILRTANVFETEEDEKLVSVGFRTTGLKNVADISVYLLSNQSSSPEDGVLLTAFSVQPEYAGYHRVSLPEALHLKNGSKFSVVTEIQEILESGETIYKYSVNMTPNLEESQEQGLPIYGKAVVNAGESFLYKNGTWTDWTVYKTTDEFKELYAENEHVYSEIDNFTIKAYLVLDESDESETIPAINTGMPVQSTMQNTIQLNKGVQTGVHSDAGLWIVILLGSIICIFKFQKEIA